ncbi:MAG TPA: hypothetical protein VGR35_17460 [Tepidisphaeraceae bacterium]|nr:hypothetical protein [Tepidisphaeraceae bacterium]
MSLSQSPASNGSSGDIVARAGRYYRNTRYIMCALLVGAGLWFAYDGWIGWPEHNRKLAEVKRRIDEAERAGDQNAAAVARTELGKMSKEKSNSDILLQKVLALSLPPVGIGLLVWALYNSRGAYRLSGRTLHVPGHPPITFDQITRIDKRLWDRKGIAFLDYEAGQAKGTIKLDDFVYERQPTDQIFERIEQEIAPAPSPDAAEPDTTAGS